MPPHSPSWPTCLVPHLSAQLLTLLIAGGLEATGHGEGPSPGGEGYPISKKPRPPAIRLLECPRKCGPLLSAGWLASRPAPSPQLGRTGASRNDARSVNADISLLDSWREGIASIDRYDDADFRRTAWYETLRPHLSEEQRNMIERPPRGRAYVFPRSGRGVKDLFTGEVDRIDREWDLRP